MWEVCNIPSRLPCLSTNSVVPLASSSLQWQKTNFPTSNHSSPRTCRRSLLYFCCRPANDNVLGQTSNVWLDHAELQLHNHNSLRRNQTNYGPANCHGLLKNTSIYTVSGCQKKCLKANCIQLLIAVSLYLRILYPPRCFLDRLVVEAQ